MTGENTEVKGEDGERAPWVVAIDGGGSECLRCRDKLTNRLPMAVEEWCRRTILFVEIHWKCVEPKPNEECGPDCRGLPIVTLDERGRPTTKLSDGKTYKIGVCGAMIPAKGDLPEEPCGRDEGHEGRHARVPSAAVRRKRAEEARGVPAPGAQPEGGPVRG